MNKSSYQIELDFLYESNDLYKQEVYKEVLQWIESNFFTGEVEGYSRDVPDHIVQGKFETKEQMIQEFKEQFNIE